MVPSARPLRALPMGLQHWHALLAVATNPCPSTVNICRYA